MPERAPQAVARTGRRRGFTLVELLVALVLAVLIAVAVVALYGTATRTVADQQARARWPHAAARVLDLMADDLARAFFHTTVTNDFFVLENGGSNQPAGVTARLTFCTLDPNPGGEPAWAGVRRVTYRVEAGAEGALLREDQPLTGPGSATGPSTNVMLRDINLFSVEVFDGADWQGAWAAKAGDARTPRITRVAIGSPDWPTQQAELMIPAGHSVTSRLIRQSGEATP